MPVRPRPIDKSQYVHLAALRRTLRGFMKMSSDAARTAGLTPQQHQALLAIKGMPGQNGALVGDIARSLILTHQSAVGLVDRLVRRGLARRIRPAGDQRRVEVRLTRSGESRIAGLSETHLAELRLIGPELRRILGSLGRAGATGRRSGRSRGKGRS